MIIIDIDITSLIKLNIIVQEYHKICFLCLNYATEDMEHFLIKFPIFDKGRQKHLSDMRQKYEAISEFDKLLSWEHFLNKRGETLQRALLFGLSTQSSF